MANVLMNSQEAIIIFTRNPELGKVKSRLAKTIGNEKALLVYKELLLHTKNIALQIQTNRFVFYSENIVENDFWDNNSFQKELQIGGDLGERMSNAFQFVFNLGYEKAVIIGSDLFDLEPDHINEAFQKLHNHDIVIGPAEDGGYYLLGMKKLYKPLFQNKIWGTSTVLASTLQDCQNLKIYQLETLNDIDTAEDLMKNATKWKEIE